MKEIILTQGYVALVDDIDYERVNKYKWYVHKSGSKNVLYARARICGKQILMHRMILNLNKGQFTDHVSGDGLNNQKSNLRLCSITQNAQNKKSHKKSSSQFKGVSWRKKEKCWKSNIMVNGKAISLGYHRDEKEAAKAYNVAAIRYHGEFASLNQMEI